MSAGPEDETSKQMRRAHYEIGALWQRVRNLKRDKSDTDHNHALADVSGRAARVWLGSSQSISSSTWEKVLVDSVTDDPDGLFDSANNEIGADKAGWWLVLTGVGYNGDSGGNRRYVAIAHNGARIVQANIPPPGADIANVPVADVVKVAAGDTFEVHGWQNSGGSLGLVDHPVHTWLSAAYLGSA